MIEPKIDDLLSRVDSKYTLVILAARRARQINGYYSQLGEGIGEFVPPMVDAGPNRKALSVALQELVEDKLNWERPAEVAESIKQRWPSRQGVPEGPHWPGPGCCSGSPAGSPPTRRPSWPVSCSAPGQRSSPCSPPPASGW